MQPCQETPSLVQNLARNRAEPLSLHEEEPAGRETLREWARAWDWSYAFKKKKTTPKQPPHSPSQNIIPSGKINGRRQKVAGWNAGGLGGTWPRRRWRFGLSASPGAAMSPARVCRSRPSKRGECKRERGRAAAVLPARSQPVPARKAARYHPRGIQGCSGAAELRAGSSL